MVEISVATHCTNQTGLFLFVKKSKANGEKRKNRQFSRKKKTEWAGKPDKDAKTICREMVLCDLDAFLHIGKIRGILNSFVI